MIDPNRRLRNLRELNGMTQKAFAAELGIGQPQLSQIERGDRQLTAQHMVTARQRFNIPLDFFSAAPITYGPNDLNYRTRRLTQSQQDRAATLFGLTEQEVRIAANTTNPTGSIGASENADRGVRGPHEIEAFAGAARQLIGVRSDKVVNNVTRCIERLGILVTGLNLPDLSSRIDGISSPERTEEPFVVAINLDKSGDRLRFSAAHELGHVLLHTEEDRPLNREDREIEADAFASAFLLPCEPMLEELSPGLTLAGYARIKARWGVSIQAIVRRACDLRVIDKDRYRSLQVQISTRGWRTDEPVDVPREIPAIPTPDIGGVRRMMKADNVVSMFGRSSSGRMEG
jgi:Zn-dependent peptidase ImmA (M78 family)/DNA-binding XRE family transcriptional regulator